MHDLATVVNKRLAFREERNWGQFHTPRNLAAALAIEVGELQEAMLWKTDEEDWDPDFWRVHSGQSGPRAQGPLPLEKKLQAARGFRSQARSRSQGLSLIRDLLCSSTAIGKSKRKERAVP